MTLLKNEKESDFCPLHTSTPMKNRIKNLPIKKQILLENLNPDQDVSFYDCSLSTVCSDEFSFDYSDDSDYSDNPLNFGFIENNSSLFGINSRISDEDSSNETQSNISMDMDSNIIQNIYKIVGSPKKKIRKF
ncbi:hypothetical protein A3Q56_01516 [Intoshia linei]|uniref:Uncharacterized protein n=1 Tax=Intoshia linei TaxID=1819745 RepID=A0A177B8U9_9BILA|nr:hypothetical protein A3Q56_01516 [Intoshia linei]